MLMSAIPGQKSRLRIGHWLLGAAVLALLLCLALWMCVPRQDKGVPRQDTGFERDPRFIVTTMRTIDVPSSSTPIQWASFWWFKVQQKFRRPRSLSYSFPASAKGRCSIHGLLNQCTDVTGVRYVIASDVAAGSVQFGPTNTLNGAQWVKA